MNHSGRRALFAALLLLLLFALFPASGEGFSVSADRKIVSYAENTFRIQAPEEGDLTLTFRDENTVYRTLTLHVSPGENTLTWDGLGYNEERLKTRYYQVVSVLAGASGRVWEHTFNAYVDYSAQALILGLPSADHLYLDAAEDWFIEAKVVLKGALAVDLRRPGESEPAYAWRKDVSGGKILKLSLAALAGKNLPEPGTYQVEVYTPANPAYRSVFPLFVEEHSPSPVPLSVTGNIMPSRGDSDEEIWRKMRLPATVVDIPFAEHQQVYEQADASSSVLGTLHGQSQALSVYELKDGWARVGAWNHEEGEYIEGWVPADRLKVVQPQGDYGLLLDKKAQTLTVYCEGEKLDTLLVSTGRMEKDELYQETAAGSFLTGQHRVDFSTNGLKYDFVIQYDGGNLLHQIPYAHGNNRKDFAPGADYLGCKASHACIRIQAAPGEGGLNAYWIWTHVPYHTRLIILDDPIERRAEAALISGRLPVPDDSSPVVDSSGEEDPASGPDTVVLTFGGDTVLGGRESYWGNRESFMAYLEAEGEAYPFSGLRRLFSEDDWTCLNLEGTLKETREGEDVSRQWRFRGLPAYARLLPAASVDLVCVANNHTGDYGDAGYSETLSALEGQVLFCGNEQNRVAEIRGHLFGFGACRETTYKSDPDVIARDIAALKAAGCEVIIYQCHWGTEYSPSHNALQEAMARACVRAGASLVIGHHPHVVQGIDFIDDVPVVYSLGNLLFGGTIRLKTFDAMLARVRFTFTASGVTPSLQLIPVLTSSRAAEGINDYRPMQAEGEDKTRILRSVQADTPFALSEIMFPEDKVRSFRRATDDPLP